MNCHLSQVRPRTLGGYTLGSANGAQSGRPYRPDAVGAVGWRLPGPFGLCAGVGSPLLRLSGPPLSGLLLPFSVFNCCYVSSRYYWMRRAVNRCFRASLSSSPVPVPLHPDLFHLVLADARTEGVGRGQHWRSHLYFDLHHCVHRVLLPLPFPEPPGHLIEDGAFVEQLNPPFESIALAQDRVHHVYLNMGIAS